MFGFLLQIVVFCCIGLLGRNVWCLAFIFSTACWRWGWGGWKYLAQKRKFIIDAAAINCLIFLGGMCVWFETFIGSKSRVINDVNKLMNETFSHDTVGIPVGGLGKIRAR